MNRKTVAIAAVATIIALALYLALRPRGGSAPDARQAAVQRYVSAEGKLEARPGADLEVGTGMTERIERFLVHEGDHVEQGQVIAVLDSRDLGTRLRQAEAELKVAQARLAEVAAGARDEEIRQAAAALQRAQSEQVQATRDFKRAGELFRAKFVSQATLDQADSASQVATARVAEAAEQLQLLQSGPRPETLALYRAEVAQAAANVRHVRSMLEETRVVSPISGTMIERYLDVGEVTMPEKPLAVIADTSRLRINAEVDETDAGRLKVGDAVEITAYAYPGKVYKGRIEEIADYVGKRELKPNNPAVNLGLKIIQVKIALLEATPLKLGMTVDVRITTGEK